MRMVEEPKYRRFYIDWWRIKKSTVYSLIFMFAFLALTIGSGWLLIRTGFVTIGKEEISLPANAAKIVSFEGDVRVVRTSTRSSEKVTTRTFVLAGDTIQTGPDGKAEILMIDGSTLWVRPNSTVVIRDNSSILGGTNVRVSLGTGQINVRTEDQTDSSQNIVEVKESQNRLLARTEASFNINQKFGTGEIRISRGAVETSIGGEKTILTENEFAAVNDGKIAAREKLLPPPKLIAPQSLLQIASDSEGKADINFRWQKLEGQLASYDFQISTSPFFVPDAMIKESEGLSVTEMIVANLTPGVYYWRVRATASSGQVTEWSEPWRFTIVRKEEKKALNATNWQVENLGGGIYRVSAKTKPGVTVRILGRETFALNDGSFTIQIRSFASEVKVEILDENGTGSEFLLSLTNGRILN
ncbi:MAG: hypothetical protein D6735_07560 [Acidobacteria bacterium]|nr:MAG: hypothetical protein D6735_07560 [Acidobacteriota bacterium]